MNGNEKISRCWIRLTLLLVSTACSTTADKVLAAALVPKLRIWSSSSERAAGIFIRIDHDIILDGRDLIFQCSRAKQA
jgi:hypothetical protein